MKSLNTLCFNCIVENFEIFMNAYDLGYSPRNFEFLQRKYSVHLLQASKSRSNFEKYIQFLLNPYLKEVNLGDIELTDAEPVIERLTEIGDTITALNLRPGKCTETLLLELTSYLHNIESLTLSACLVSANILRNIKNNCTTLKALDISGCDVTDEDMKALWSFENEETDNTSSKNSSLEYLYIDRTEVTTIGVAGALKNLPKLRWIVHPNVFDALHYLHFADFKNNVPHPYTYNLEILNTGPNFAKYPLEILGMCASVCPNLKWFSVADISVQSQINALTEFHKLKKLIVSVDNSAIDLSPLIEKRGGTLENLQFFYGKISAEILLKYCPELKELCLRSLDFLPFNDSQFDTTDYGFQHLTKIIFKGIDFEEDNNANSLRLILASCPNLINLSLQRCVLKEKFISSNSKAYCLQHLEHLDLTVSIINFYSAEALLLASPNLKTINLAFCTLTIEERKELLRGFKFVRADQMAWYRHDPEYSSY